MTNIYIYIYGISIMHLQTMGQVSLTKTRKKANICLTLLNILVINERTYCHLSV